MIYTFYSYKGGVGRSMALANVAELFYQAGLKVLVVDWDLEAPGLERFFPVDPDEVRCHQGLIEMLLEYKKCMSQELLSLEENNKDFPFPTPLSYTVDIYQDGGLLLLPAGQRNNKRFADYAQSVRTFDWQDFYQNWEGELYFEWLHQQFEDMADVILVDSRTGVAEMGGICIYQLADVVVMLCAPNQQNLEGIYEMVCDLKRPEVTNVRAERPLEILVVPARVEDRSETELLNNFREQFFTTFQEFVPNSLREGVETLWQLKIPHIPFYAFNEVVAVRHKGESHSEDLVEAFNVLTGTMARLAPKESRVGRLAKNFNSPKAVSPTPSSFTNRGFGEVLSEGILSVRARQNRSIRAIQEDIAAQLSFSPASIERWRKGYVPADEGHVEFLARYIVENGKCGRTWLNRFLTLARHYDRQALLEELCPEQLSSPRASNTLCHNLPPRYGEFLGREEALARVFEGLESRWPVLSIEGLGGIGKTTLAVEAARRSLPGPEGALAQPFEAVVWVSAKDRPERKRWLIDVLDTVARVLDYPYIAQLPAAQKRLEVDRLLRARRVLVLIDNFETIDDHELLTWMPDVPEPSKVLVTNRHGGLRQVWDIHLHGLAEREAIELIHRHAKRLNLHPIKGAEDEAWRPLVRVTGGNPKAIEMALGYLKHRALNLAQVVEHFHTPSGILEDLFGYLFDSAWSTLSKDSIQTLLVIPFFASTFQREALGAAAGLDGYRLDRALEQLAELSLLDTEVSATLTLSRYGAHPLVRAFANAKLRTVPEWEREARERWAKWYMKFSETKTDWLERADLSEEISNLIEVCQWYYQSGDLHSLWKLIGNINEIWENSVEDDRWAMIISSVLGLAREQREELIIAKSLNYIARRMILNHRLSEARDVLKESRALADRLGDDLLTIEIIHHQSHLEQISQAYPEAEKLISEVEKLVALLTDENQKARWLVRIRYQQGCTDFLLGGGARAKRHLTEALGLAKKINWERMIAHSASYLGELAWGEDNLIEAKHWYDMGLEIAQASNDKRCLARLYFLGAKLAQSRGNKVEAQDLASQAAQHFAALSMSLEEMEAQKWLASL